MSVALAQNKYLDTDNRVVTKELGEATIQSNLSLNENLSNIASFSDLLTIYDLIDFEKMIQNEEMVAVFVSYNNALAHMEKE